MNSQPRISFIIPARKGGYDNDSFTTRLRTVLRLRSAFVARHKLSCESIIVQYNPPLNQPPYEEVLADLATEAMPIRIITVPESFHKKIAPNHEGPFLEYVARTIGIRRAHGEFILSTCLDVVLSDEMIARLTQPLEKDALYEARSHHMGIREIADSASPDVALEMCSNNVERVFTEYGLFYASWSRWWRRFLNKPKPKNLWMAPIFNPVRKWLAGEPLIKDVDAGNFALAHRDAWAAVRGGYSQQQLVNAYLDSYCVGMFACHGFKQIVLPQPIYHIRHNINTSREYVDVKKFERDMLAMANTGVPYTVYPENWGYPEEQFVETTL